MYYTSMGTIRFALAEVNASALSRFRRKARCCTMGQARAGRAGLPADGLVGQSGRRAAEARRQRLQHHGDYAMGTAIVV